MEVRFVASLAAAAVLALVLATPVVADAGSFRATFSGTFTIAFAACSNGDDHLHFSGPGIATQGGSSTISGDSCLRLEPLRPGCSIIEMDATTITAADGSTIQFVNAGEDCLDPTTGVIHGTATYSIVGGSGRFEGAGGSGDITVTAPVTAVTPTGASGTFNPLSFSGSITSPQE